MIEIVERFVPECAEDNELFIGLMQSIAANDVLRKFAADSIETIANQRREIRERSNLPESPELDFISPVRDRLRKAILNGETGLQPILESLHSLNDVSPLNETAYVESLEREIDQLRKELEDADTRIKSTNFDLEGKLDEIKRIEEQLSTTKSDAISEKQAAEAARRQFDAKLEKQASEIAALTKQNEGLSHEKANLASELTAIEKASKTALIELEETFEVTQLDCLKLLELKENRLKELESRVVYLRGRLTEQKKKFRESLFAERNERNAIEMQLRENLAAKIQRKDQNQAIEKLKKQAVTLKKKAASKEKQYQQELAILQSELNVKLLRAEADAQQKVEEASKVIATESRMFLTSVSRMFNSFVETRVPVTFAVTEAFLRRVKAELDRQPALLKAKTTLDEVRAVLGSQGDVVRQVAELARMGDQRGEIACLRQEMRGLVGWVEKMFLMYGGGAGEGVKDLAVMKQVLEDELQRKERGKYRQRGRASGGGKSDERPSRGLIEPNADGFVFDH